MQIPENERMTLDGMIEWESKMQEHLEAEYEKGNFACEDEQGENAETDDDEEEEDCGPDEDQGMSWDEAHRLLWRISRFATWNCEFLTEGCVDKILDVENEFQKAAIAVKKPLKPPKQAKLDNYGFVSCPNRANDT